MIIDARCIDNHDTELTQTRRKRDGHYHLNLYKPCNGQRRARRNIRRIRDENTMLTMALQGLQHYIRDLKNKYVSIISNIFKLLYS